RGDLFFPRGAVEGIAMDEDHGIAGAVIFVIETDIGRVFLAGSDVGHENFLSKRRMRAGRKFDAWRGRLILSLPKLEDSGVVEVLLRRPFDGVKNLAGCRRGGKRYADPVAEIEREAQVLVHETKREAWRVVGFEHERGFHVENAGAGHARLH